MQAHFRMGDTSGWQGGHRFLVVRSQWAWVMVLCLIFGLQLGGHGLQIFGECCGGRVVLGDFGVEREQEPVVSWELYLHCVILVDYIRAELRQNSTLLFIYITRPIIFYFLFFNICPFLIQYDLNIYLSQSYLQFIFLCCLFFGVRDRLCEYLGCFEFKIGLITQAQMDEQDGKEYLMEIEKLMSSQIACTYWAPTMDILAIVTFDNLVEGYRISFKAQRFFRIEESQSIQTLCFSPDSQYIAYSLLDGSTKIIRTENGERIVTVDNIGNQGVENLNFVPFASVNPEQFMPFSKSAIESKLILNISPHKNCNKNAIIKINYFNELREHFTCLLLSERHRAWLLLNGFIPVACLNFEKNMKLNPQASEFRILHSHLDDKLYSIVAEEVQDTYNLVLLLFEAEQLLKIKHDVVKYNCLMSNITEIINFTDTTYTALEACMRDIVRQYNSKINLIDDSTSSDVIPREELLKYLSIGITSSTLTNFFTKEIYDTKMLQKLDETLTSLFTNLHDIIIESVQNGLEKATLLLLKLCSYSEVHKYEQFGIKTQEFKEVEQKIIRLYTLGEMLLVESTQTKFNIRNLLIWLNKASIKTAQENQTEIENAKSYLNKYTVDYTRLHKFLSDEASFRLDNLLRFFRKTEEKQAMVRPQPDFSMLASMGQTSKSKATQQQVDLYHFLEKELELEGVSVDNNTVIEVEYSFQSFKVEMRNLLVQWKALSARPCQQMGEKLSNLHSRHQIGKVTITELYPFQPKFVVGKDQHVYMYYIDRQSEQYDRIIKYDCSTQVKSSLYTDKFNIAAISVAEEVIGIFEQKMEEKKLVAQVANQKFDGGEIQFGRIISNCDQGELSIDSSMRGLNSLVIGKTKLVIFD